MPDGPARDDPAGRGRLADDLERLLAKLAAPRTTTSCVGGRRVGAGAAGAAAIAALLDEIDETVMARRLVLTAPDGGEIALDVCNRRLLRVASPRARDVGAGNLTYAGAAELTALRDRLADLCKDGDVRIVAHSATGGATLEQTGVAVATLRQAWALPVGEAVADPETLYAAARDVAPSGIRIEAGSVTDRFGQSARADALAVLLDGPEVGELIGADDPSVLLLEGDPARPALLLIVHGAMRAALALEPGNQVDRLRALVAERMP